jgi:hypothetical protein
MRKTSWIFPVAVSALLALCTAGSPAEDSFDYVVTVGDEKLTFVARPELGYVVKTQQKTGGISVLSSTLSFLASDFGELGRAEHIKPILQNFTKKGIGTHQKHHEILTVFCSHRDKFKRAVR